MISTVDREARHTRKSKSKRRDGFRGHVAAEPETGLITDCEMTMAAGDGSTDAENGVKMAGRDRFHPPAAGPAAPAQPQDGGPSQARPQDAQEPDQAAPADAEPRDGQGLEVYGDSAYGSGEARAAYRDAGHDTVIKPGPVRPAVPGGFTIDAACHLRERCTTAAGGRSMTIHPQDGLLRAARSQAHTEEVLNRADHRLDRDPERPAGQAALHRHRQERCLAAHPLRRDQPADPAQGRPDALRRGLGPGLTGPDRLTSGPACCQAYRRSPIQGRAAARTVARTGEIIRQQGQSAPRQRPRHRLIQRAPRLVRPMLATLRHGLPADHDRYGWEFKWDGMRAIAYVSSDQVSLVSRNDKEMAARYPDLAVLASRVKAPVLDGEIVVLRGGRPDFGALQSRMHVRRPTARLVEGTPVQLYLFDLLHYDEESLLGLPYTKRRDRLEELGLDADPVRTPPWYRDGRGDRPGRQSRAWPGGGGRQAADLPLLSGQAPGLDQGQERPASGGRDLRVETR